LALLRISGCVELFSEFPGVLGLFLRCFVANIGDVHAKEREQCEYLVKHEYRVPILTLGRLSSRRPKDETEIIFLLNQVLLGLGDVLEMLEEERLVLPALKGKLNTKPSCGLDLQKVFSVLFVLFKNCK